MHFALVQLLCLPWKELFEFHAGFKVALKFVRLWLSSWILHHLSVPDESTDGKDGFLCGRTKCSMNRFGWVFTAKWAYVMLKGYRPSLCISPGRFNFKPVKTRHWFSSPYTGKGTVHIIIRYLYTYTHNKLVLWTQRGNENFWDFSCCLVMLWSDDNNSDSRGAFKWVSCLKLKFTEGTAQCWVVWRTGVAVICC